MTSTRHPKPDPAAACSAQFTMIGAAGRRFRVGQWHANAGGIPLVVLNGIGMNIEMLEPVARECPGRWLIAVDMPGIGQSPDPIFPYTIPQIALTLAALFDRMQIDVVDMLGISWGGAVAQQFAFQHRARARRMVLAASTAGNVMVAGNPSSVAPMLDPLAYSVESALRRNLATLYNGGGSGRVSLNAATPPSPLGYMCQLGAMACWNSAPILPLLSLPVMIMADTEDQLVPVANAHFLHNAIPGSRLELFEGGGHLFMLSWPDRFAALLDDFLA
ncbi:alpha/beta hydrolase [Novosphingobium sp.]|uniref:alpha/beta fold hydrolase n=1 Tax=Novosphingobium sp. TaxID=1874826 RepID=UPI00334050C9